MVLKEVIGPILFIFGYGGIALALKALILRGAEKREDRDEDWDF